MPKGCGRDQSIFAPHGCCVPDMPAAGGVQSMTAEVSVRRKLVALYKAALGLASPDSSPAVLPSAF